MLSTALLVLPTTPAMPIPLKTIASHVAVHKLVTSSYRIEKFTVAGAGRVKGASP